ncbi:syntaxin-17 isoform X2 [Tachysurus fulvidraco]|uniref:syntaxin-17 isoform X2 n=1 Tax=Tachysurus fulvidraco TaxID=1234273 RepID=UPI000F5147E0|nr:syntaxin-17 isoform X2 [Tachysurus fulvidraco]
MINRAALTWTTNIECGIVRNGDEMTNFHRNQQWDKLHQEHINASRTVQQLRSNLHEMEKLCHRVRSSEASSLEKLVQPIRERALVAAQDFLRLHSDSVNHPGTRPHQADGTDTHTTSDSAYSEDDVGGDESPVTQFQVYLPAIPAEQNAAESWDSLEEDLLELNGLVKEFCSLVHAQQEKIDSIEANVITATANVEEGTRSLGKAAKSSLAMLPVAGAVVGTVLAGPLGLLAGFKVAGMAAAVGGGLIGFAGGNFIQRKKKERVELQLQRLNTNHEHEHVQ